MRMLLAGLVAGLALAGCGRGDQSISHGADEMGRKSAAGPLPRAVFSPDGSRLLVTFHSVDLGGMNQAPPPSRTLSATLWDTATGKLIRPYPGHDRGMTTGDVFLPDGRSVLTASDGLRLWDVATGATIRTFAKSERNDYCLALTPDGRRALTGASYSGEIRLWDVATGALLRDYRTSLGMLTSITISPDGKTALVQRGNQTPDDSSHKLLDLSTGRWTWSLNYNDGYDPDAVAFSPDGKHAAMDFRCIAPADRAETRRRNAQICQHVAVDAASGKVVRAFPRRYYESPRGYSRSLALQFTPDGKRLRTADDDGKLRVYDVATCREVRTASIGRHQVLALSPDGTRVLTTNDFDELGRRDETIWPRLDVRDATDGRPVATLDLSGAQDAGIHLGIRPHP